LTLQGPASIAGLLVTTEAMVANNPQNDIQTTRESGGGGFEPRLRAAFAHRGRRSPSVAIPQ
jgi:hypothetical protein